MSGPWLARWTAVAALSVLPALSLAQENGTDPAPPAGNAGGTAASVFGSIGNMFSDTTRKVGGFFDREPEKPLLMTVVPGAYQPSNEAIGEERDIESRRVENYGLVPIKAYLDYANGIYARLKDATGITGLPGNVFLLASQDLKATSSPDGNLFLSIAWIKTMESEDELAAMLAHELAHVVLHHHDSTMLSTAQKKAQFLFASAADLKNTLEKASSLTAGALSPGQTKALRHMELLIDMTDTVLLPAWSRGQELDADRLALDLLRKTGYSVIGMTSFLDHVAKWEDAQEVRRKARDAELQASMQSLVQAGNMDAAWKSGVEGGVSSLRAFVSAQHDGAAKRQEELAIYREKYHADMPRVAIRTDAYRDMLAQRTVKPTLDAYDQTFAAMTAIEQQRFADAVRQLTPVTRAGAPAATHAMPNYELYLAMVGMGNPNALGQLEKSFAAPEPAWKPYEEAIRYVARNGKRERALQIAAQARTRFKDAPALSPQMVGIYTELGFNDQAKQELATCRMSHVAYRDACQQRSKSK